MGVSEQDYRKGSLSLTGTVAMGTGVMIGAGIFALTGQVAELAGPWFPVAFAAAALVAGLSAYSYVKVSSAYPSAGGIAMILSKAYGRTAVAAGAAMLMAFSMVINESLVARTFGTYVVQLVDVDDAVWVPVLAVGLILVAFAINIAGNKAIGAISKVTAAVKVGGILAFAGVTLWVSGFTFEAAASSAGPTGSVSGFLAGTALAVLAYKGFTTITNSGDEVTQPRRNIGRAIVISLVLCAFVYLLVTVAVGSALSVPEIVQARDYSLAEAARPALGDLGVTLTVVLAIIATTSGLLASFFAVSRMLAMLTDMELIPHRHFGMPGRIQHHTLVYTAVLAALIAVLFDLSRIAAIGAIFYLVMDITIHWGVLRHLRTAVEARPWPLVAAIIADAVVLTAFLALRSRDDPLIVVVATGAIAVTFAFEALYLRARRGHDDDHHHDGEPPRRPEGHRGSKDQRDDTPAPNPRG